MKGFYHIWDLGHVTSIMSSDFHFFVPENFHKNLVQIGTAVSEKIWFEFVYVHDLVPRSRNDLDHQYSHTFIYSIRCMLLLTFKLSLDPCILNRFSLFGPHLD